MKALEERIAELDALLNTPDAASDYQKISDAFHEKEAAEAELETVMEQYFTLE